jgi:probable HAF family extracellular repeat protein
MKRKSLTVLMFAFALAPTCLAAKEKISRYEVTDLGTLGGVRSVACGLNNRGEVTGNSSVAARPEHAFVWRDGVITDLGILPATSPVLDGASTTPVRWQVPPPSRPW